MRCIVASFVFISLLYHHSTCRTEILFYIDLLRYTIRSMSNIYSELFSSVSTNIDTFVQTVKSKKSTLMSTDEWTVKDELCHIVFWHENYAANYGALAAHKTPPIPEGMSTMNMAGVLWLRNCAMKELYRRLQEAHDSLYASIVVKKVPQMTYSKGGRIYTTDDFLAMIARHIESHTKRVKRAI